MTRFSKTKLTKVQEIKARIGLSSGLLLRKRQRESKPSKDDVMVTSLVAKFQDCRPASPTSSLELIVSPGGAALRPKPRVTSRLLPLGKTQGLLCRRLMM